MAERTFYVKAIRLENEIAFGITEQRNDKTIYIASVYLNGEYSRTQMFNAWNRHVSNLLAPGDKVMIFTNDLNAKSRHRLKWPRHIFVIMHNKSVMQEADSLCKDALKRKTTITEVLNE